MPPPNITGALHLGHALFLTIQDIATRHRIIRGDDALWIPGTDHAGLATHDKLCEDMSARGLNIDDPIAYEREAWAWKDKFHARITGQMRRMGASCDWTKERFTLDEDYAKTTSEAFARIATRSNLTRRDGQWYIDMSEPAAALLAALDSGEIAITPLSATGRLRHFLSNIQPWCLSRQIPWGQRMPLQYDDAGNWRIAETSLPSGWHQETSTFDTWFLSSLWPLALLGWPEETQELERFYPAAWMETGEDILFFWCARMLMMGWLLTGKWAFTSIYLHGLIRDSQGRKMAKQLGNGIDPLDLIDQKGTDALRWMLATHSQPGLDMRFNPARLSEESRFINKIWQASRFLSSAPLLPLCSWPQTDFASSLEALTSRWDDGLLACKFAETARDIQRHFRDEFCGKWLEEHKASWREGVADIHAEGRAYMARYLILLHPFMPFLTSEIQERLLLDASS
jgi:valyl-tRNA synthetase